MVRKRATNFDEFKAELLKDPEVFKEYEALKPKYEMIRSVIKRRNELQISQKQLAKIIGKQQPAISRLENGDHNTTINTLFAVVNALDLDISVKARTKARQPHARAHA